MKGKYELINNHFIDAFHYFNKAVNYKAKDYELYIYKGLTEFMLGKFENSLISYQYALQLFETTKNLNEDEKNYLKIYIFKDILNLFKILKIENKNLYIYKILYKDLKYDRKNIRHRFFYDFPLEEVKEYCK